MHIRHQPSATEQTSNDWQRLLWVVNYHSSNAEALAEVFLSELELSPYADKLVEICTSGDTDRDVQTIAQNLQPGDVLLRASGDGGNEALAKAQIAAGIYAPIVPLPGGNGNDLTKMVYGNPQRFSLVHILDYAQNIAVHPIVCDIATKEVASQRLGINYASLGWMATCGTAFNAEAYRRRAGYDNPLLRSMYEMWETAIVTKSAGEVELVGRDGESSSVFDRTYANGNRMAKHGRLPENLTRPDMLALQIGSKSYKKIATRIGGMAIGRLKGTYIPLEAFDAYTIGESGADFQIDGETLVLEPGTQLTIRLGKRTVDMLSTK